MEEVDPTKLTAATFRCMHEAPLRVHLSIAFHAEAGKGGTRSACAAGEKQTVYLQYIVLHYTLAGTLELKRSEFVSGAIATMYVVL